MHIDCDIDGPWPAQDWPDIAGQASAALARVAPELANARLSVSLLFTGDAEIQTLNAEWRGKNRPTNVLSFPMLAREELLALAAEGPPVLLGDVALAAETCAREAVEKGAPLVAHASHLIIHGLLHLAGHDHETSAADAAAMEALEIRALALLGIADPYAEAGYTGRPT